MPRKWRKSLRLVFGQIQIVSHLGSGGGGISNQNPPYRIYLIFSFFHQCLLTLLENLSRGFPMAEMIPERLPGGHSKGEERVFSILQRLPDDHIVYFEPVIKQRYPDFVVIFPENGSKEYRKYDAILVDEAQDFEVSWFKCVLEAMKEPYDGDLIIVGDGNQGLFPRGKVNWKEIGINAQGRTIYKKFDLEKNYRNSREIIELAATFVKPSVDDGDSIISLQVDPNKCVRSTGIKPVLVKSRNQKEECTRVLDIVKNLLNGQWFGQQIEALEPEDIGIFYPRKNIELIRKFISSLKEFAPVIWLNETPQSRIRVSEPGVKIQTIHSAKGLQYRAVILMWAHLLPSSFKNSDEETDRRLFYVGLTRPEDFLAISTSAFSKSKFITEIEKSGKAVIA